MVAADDILSSLGISVGVGNPSNHQSGSLDTYQSPPCEYPTGTVSTLSTTTVITMITLMFVVFKFRKILARYTADWFSFSLSDRTDLQVKLIYEFRAGTELISSVEMTNRDPEPVELEELVISDGYECEGVVVQA